MIRIVRPDGLLFRGWAEQMAEVNVGTSLPHPDLSWGDWAKAAADDGLLVSVSHSGFADWADWVNALLEVEEPVL